MKVTLITEPQDRPALEAWLQESRARLSYVSRNGGCGCCVDIYYIEGPHAIVEARPAVLTKGSSAWDDSSDEVLTIEESVRVDCERHMAQDLDYRERKLIHLLRNDAEVGTRYEAAERLRVAALGFIKARIAALEYSSTEEPPNPESETLSGDRALWQARSTAGIIELYSGRTS